MVTDDRGPRIIGRLPSSDDLVDRGPGDSSGIVAKLSKWWSDKTRPMAPPHNPPVGGAVHPRSSCGLVCNRLSSCPKTRADAFRLQCQDRHAETNCNPCPPLAPCGPPPCGPPPCGPPPMAGPAGPPPVPPCAPKPPCVPPCSMCPPCLQPCRPCPPCPPPCRPCIPCPPNISKPACSDYSHTTTECYAGGCGQPCRWDNTSYYNEGNDAGGNVVRQWNTSCHFATRPTNGSCSQLPAPCSQLPAPCPPPCGQMPASHNQYVVNVPCGPASCPPECPRYPFRCRREVIINLPKERRALARPTATTATPLVTSPTTTAVSVSPATKVGLPVSPSPKGRGRRSSRGRRSPGKRSKSPAKKSPRKSPRKSPKRSPRRSPKSPSKRSPKKSPAASPKRSIGRKGSRPKSPVKQIVFARPDSDTEDFDLAPVLLDTSMFSNRSSQLRWIENQRRLCNVNRRSLSDAKEEEESRVEVYRDNVDCWREEPDFETTDTASSYLRRCQGQERAARLLEEWPPISPEDCMEETD